MILSMTGFCERRFHSRTLSARIRIKTLNHRFFDWNCFGTQTGELEDELRSLCQKKIHRGKVDVHIELNFLTPEKWTVQINRELFRKVISSIESISSKMKNKLNFSLENFFRIPHLVEIRIKKLNQEEKSFLNMCFEKTLDGVVMQRKKEGREITRAIRKCIQNIKQSQKKIEALAKKQPFLIRDRLNERLKELMQGSLIKEEKLIEEAAYYAQKYDLTEEIERLKGHLKYIQELLLSRRDSPAGKKMDFITQEIYRETNTIGSKSQDFKIIQETLAIKGEAESIRQQIQNIE